MCIPVPVDCTDEAAAIGQPCAVALHALSRGGITVDQPIALFGVRSIGSLLLAAIQAQAAGVQRVIALDVEQGRLNTARGLGESYQIDARSLDPVAVIGELTSGHGVDVAIDGTGVPETIARLRGCMESDLRPLEKDIEQKTSTLMSSHSLSVSKLPFHTASEDPS